MKTGTEKGFLQRLPVQLFPGFQASRMALKQSSLRQDFSKGVECSCSQDFKKKGVLPEPFIFLHNSLFNNAFSRLRGSKADCKIKNSGAPALSQPLN